MVMFEYVGDDESWSKANAPADLCTEENEPVCAICGWLLSEHGMEGYAGHLFTHHDREAEEAESAEIERERAASIAADDRRYRGMELFGGILTGDES